MLGPLHLSLPPVASGTCGGTPPVQVPERQSRPHWPVAGSYLKARRPPPWAGATISARPSPSRSPSATDEGDITASAGSSKLNCCVQSLPLMIRRTPGLVYEPTVGKLVNTIEGESVAGSLSRSKSTTTGVLI